MEEVVEVATKTRRSLIKDSAPAPDRIRVLACSGSLDGGGSERQLWQFASQLDRAKFAPEVYLLSRRGPYLQQLPDDVTVHAFSDDHSHPGRFPPGRISWLQSRHLRQLVKRRRIDVVYDRTYHMTLLTSVALSRHTPRVSVIVSPPSRDFTASESRFVNIKRWLLARAYRRAAATLCVSSEVADDAAIFYRLNREALQVVPNPIDFMQVQRKASEPLPQTAEQLAQKQPDEIHAAVIGRFTSEKGHQLALEVTGRLAQTALHATGESNKAPLFHLHLVGDGPLHAHLADEVKRLKLGHRVHRHGYLTNPYPVLRHCDIAFVPSQYEGFPNVALEALALGVPLLMTDYGVTARHIVGRDALRGQLIAPGDVDAAVAAVLDRWQQPHVWYQRATEGQAWVQREHAIAPWFATMSCILERVTQAGYLSTVDKRPFREGDQ